MSRWRSEALALGLDGQALAVAGRVVAQAAGPWDAATLACGFSAALNAASGDRGDSGGTGGSGGAPVVASLARDRRRAARVLVAPDLCRHFPLAPPAGLRSLAELQDLAQVRALQLFGAGPWVVTADWRLDAPFPCAALPRALHEALQQAAREAGFALQLESSVLAAWARAAPAPGLAAFATPQHVVLGRSDAAGPLALRCLRRTVGGADGGGVEVAERAAEHGAHDGAQKAAHGTAASARALATQEAAREALRGQGAGGPGAAEPSSGGLALQWLLPVAEQAHEGEAAWASRVALSEAG